MRSPIFCEKTRAPEYSSAPMIKGFTRMNMSQCRNVVGCYGQSVSSSKPQVNSQRKTTTAIVVSLQ